MNKQDGGAALYLDDLAVGDEFCSATHVLTKEQIIAFAAAYDPQPFHMDEQAAEQSFFRGLAASGWHTVALTMRLIVESVPLAQGIIGAGADVAWLKPVRPGDVLRVRSRILEIMPSASRPDRATLVVESLTLNQQDEVLQRLTARLLAFRKAG